MALNVQDGRAPDWVQLTPPGSQIAGRDGRGWRLTDPEAVIAAFRASAKKPQIDIEHSSQLLAPQGHPAPAVCWIEDIEVRDAALWGRTKSCALPMATIRRRNSSDSGLISG